MVAEAYAYRLPDGLDDVSAAPLLLAGIVGIVGYRALRRADLPPAAPRRLRLRRLRARRGASGARAGGDGARADAVGAGPGAGARARSGVGRPGRCGRRPSRSARRCRSPPQASSCRSRYALDQGGTLAVAGIHLSDVPTITYADELFRETQLRSVTANTRADGEEFLRLAAALGVTPTVVVRPMAEADRALADLAADRITGAAVLVG